METIKCLFTRYIPINHHVVIECTIYCEKPRCKTMIEVFGQWYFHRMMQRIREKEY